MIKDWNFSDAGGRVNFGETAEAGVIREFKEELNVNIAYQRLIWVEESFWRENNKTTHSICFYSLVSLKNDTDLPESFAGTALDNDEVIFEWVALDDLSKLTVYPQFIKDKIKNITDGVEHFVRNDT